MELPLPEQNLYLQDILSQPQALESALSRLDLSVLDELTRRLNAGDYDRIMMTGMGASLYGLYPAWLHLAEHGLPALWVDSAELLHHTLPLVTPRTLLWMASQSGRSAEIVRLVEVLQGRGQTLLALVNDLGSPLAQAADLVLPIDVLDEGTVSTRTFINTLALAQLAALRLCGVDLSPHLEDLVFTVQGMTAYLQDWPAHLSEIDARIGMPEVLFFLGRGPSFASAQAVAQIQAEAAKFPAQALQTAEFRHGTIEIAGPSLTALIYAGPPAVQALNRRLLEDLLGYNARAFWLEAGRRGDEPFNLGMPATHGIGLPLAEILPGQLLSIHLALKNGWEPGTFQHIGKVTLTE